MKVRNVMLIRNAGHPWDGRKGFDLMFVESDSEHERDDSVESAASKFWKPWLVGANEKSGKPCVVFFKPSGLNRHWDDSPENPHWGCIDGVEITLEKDPHILTNARERQGV